MTYTYFSVDMAGGRDGLFAYDVWTKFNGHAGIISQRKDGWKVWTNLNATKGPKRLFKTQTEALDYLFKRRIRRGNVHPSVII